MKKPKKPLASIPKSVTKIGHGVPKKHLNEERQKFLEPVKK